MHECNAKENPNEKHFGHKRMKELAQGPKVSKEKLWTCDNTNHLTKRLKLAPIKRFGKNFSILTISGIYSRATTFLSIGSLIK